MLTTKKNYNIQFPNTALISIEKVKVYFTNAISLSYPNANAVLYRIVDFSTFAFGVVLQQHIDDEWKLIFYLI